MRVLHILDHSLPLQSGYVFRTLGLLAAQRARGWTTFQLTTPKQPCATPVDVVDGWTFHRTPAAGAPLPVWNELAQMSATARRLRALITDVRPDILHAHSPVLNGYPALKAARAMGRPVVYEVRAFWEDAAVDHGTAREGDLRYRATRAFETHVMRRVDHVFTICEGLRQDMLGRGIPADKVTVIPNAVDIDRFHAANHKDPEILGRLGMTREQLILGFIGSFYDYEGLDVAIEAMEILRERRPDARLLLVGGGPQDEALHALARAKGLEDRVVFTGRVPHADVDKYYGLVDLLLYPRRSMRLTETVTPLKPLEAMAQEKIFIASDVGGHRELVRDDVTGYLCRAGDAHALAARIEQAVAARDTWPAIRSAGRRFVEQERNWTASAARYAPVYERLVGRGRAEAA